MNAGCFNHEIKDVLLSIQVIDKLGNISTIPANKIKESVRNKEGDYEMWINHICKAYGQTRDDIYLFGILGLVVD